MLRIFLLILFIVIISGSLGYLIYKFGLHKIKLKSSRHRVTFVGGPLDGQNRRLAKTPETFEYIYDVPTFIRATENVGDEAYTQKMEAVYEFDGEGKYVYWDSVHATE